MIELQVKELYKSFNIGKETIDVLKDINFEVNKGEFLSIMGASGSGKSTLLYLLGGLDNPTKGKIFVKDRDYSKINEKERSILRRREIGFVFQFYNLVQNLNVEDNILMPLLLDGKKAKDNIKNLERILDLVGIKDKRYNTPRELSGGQQQRVAIARSLIYNPNIILADEPIGNLDSKTGSEIMKLFKDINEEYGTTIIQVTHQIEASNYGKRTIFLKDGEIEKDIIYKLQ